MCTLKKEHIMLYLNINTFSKTLSTAKFIAIVLRLLASEMLANKIIKNGTSNVLNCCAMWETYDIL